MATVITMAGRIDRFSKQALKQLRDLVGDAYEAELGRELAKLKADFERWDSGESTAGELSDRIHEFHQGPSRDIYSVYRMRDPVFLVARAVALDLLDLQRVPEEAREVVEERAQGLRDLQC